MVDRDMQLFIGWCLLIGAIGAVVVTLVHPLTVADSARQMAIVAAQAEQWDLAHELLFVDLVVMMPALVGLGLLVAANGRRWAGWIGAGLVLAGIAGGIGAAVDELIVGQMARMNSAQMLALFNRIHGNGGFFVFPLAALQPIGLMVLAWGLFRAEIMPGVMAIVLAIGAGCELVGLPTASYCLALAGHGLELIGLGFMAWKLITGKEQVWNTTNT